MRDDLGHMMTFFFLYMQKSMKNIVIVGHEDAHNSSVWALLAFKKGKGF